MATTAHNHNIGGIVNQPHDIVAFNDYDRWRMVCYCPHCSMNACNKDGDADVTQDKPSFYLERGAQHYCKTEFGEGRAVWWENVPPESAGSKHVLATDSSLDNPYRTPTTICKPICEQITQTERYSNNKPRPEIIGGLLATHESNNWIRNVVLSLDYPPQRNPSTCMVAELRQLA